MRTHLIIAALFVTVLLSNTDCARHETGPVTIGAVLELTGDGAELGQDAQRGIQVASELVNGKGGVRGRKIQVLFEDSESKPEKAVSALQKLITVDKVHVVIGALFSSSTLAMAPIAERNGVVLISPGSSNPKLSEAGDFIFREYPSDTYEGTITADYMWKKMDIKTVAILYVDTDYGQGLRDVFRRRYLSLGGSISIEESYEQGSTDFRTQLSKIKQKKTQWIYMPGYYSEVAKAMAQARQLGANSRFFSNIGAADPKLFEIGKGAVDGLLITAPKLDLASGDSLTTDFLKSFEARFNRTPGFPAAYAFDTMLLVAEAMKRKGFDGVEIKQGLYSIKDFPGVTGKTTFDRNGDVIKEFIVEVARGDKFERFDTVD